MDFIKTQHAMDILQNNMVSISTQFEMAQRKVTKAKPINF